MAWPTSCLFARVVSENQPVYARTRTQEDARNASQKEIHFREGLGHGFDNQFKKQDPLPALNCVKVNVSSNSPFGDKLRKGTSLRS